MRRTMVAMATAAVLSTPLAGCGSAQPNKRVCGERTTHIRADDDRCRGSSAHYVWLYYLSKPRFYPAVGHRVTGKTSTRMPDGFRTNGSTVPRNGTRTSGRQGGSGDTSGYNKNGSGSRQGGSGVGRVGGGRAGGGRR